MCDRTRSHDTYAIEHDSRHPIERYIRSRRIREQVNHRACKANKRAKEQCGSDRVKDD